MPSHASPADMSTVPLSAQELLASLDERSFDLLTHAIDVVIQSQSFARLRLEQALRITAAQSHDLTAQLEALGVIEPGHPEAQREVIIGMHDRLMFQAVVALNRREAETTTQQQLAA